MDDAYRVEIDVYRKFSIAANKLVRIGGLEMFDLDASLIYNSRSVANIEIPDSDPLVAELQKPGARIVIAIDGRRVFSGMVEDYTVPLVKGIGAFEFNVIDDWAILDSMTGWVSPLRSEARYSAPLTDTTYYTGFLSSGRLSPESIHDHGQTGLYNDARTYFQEGWGVGGEAPIFKFYPNNKWEESIKNVPGYWNDWRSVREEDLPLRLIKVNAERIRSDSYTTIPLFVPDTQNRGELIKWPGSTAIAPVGTIFRPAPTIRFDAIGDEITSWMQNWTTGDEPYGIKLIQSDANNGVDVVFEEASDRSAMPISVETGEVIGGKFQHTAPTASRTVIGGQGEYDERMFYELRDISLEAEYGTAFEIFKDDTSYTPIWTDSNNENVPAKYYFVVEGFTEHATAYRKVLNESAKKTLSENGKIESIEIEIQESQAFYYGDPSVDSQAYNLGSKVSIDLTALNRTYTDRVRRIDVRYSADNGLVFKPVIGDPRVSIQDKEVSKLQVRGSIS
jgi:hypothetical protein